MPRTSTWRRRLPPEVVQTANLDCGPASLASLLRGLGCPASYEVLRDVCATDVDGTSINAVEQVARAAGADVEQLVVPAEQLTALPEEYLPAIAVTVLPDGFTHFVVLWRRQGRRMLVMDPAVGRRRVGVHALHGELYRHGVEVPAAAWRAWAGGEVFLDGLDTRMQVLGVTAGVRRALLDDATADPGVAGLAALDAVVREVESTPRGRAGGRPGNRHLVDTVRTRSAAWAAGGGDLWSCVPAPGSDDDDGDGDSDAVTLRGAVIVRVKGWSRSEADPALAARLVVDEPGPVGLIRELLARPRTLLAAVVAAALVVGTASVLIDVALQAQVAPTGRPAAVWPVLLVVALAAVTVAVSAVVTLRAGRAVDLAVRARWWSAVAGLPDRFVVTRPASDLAERGHLLHRVRELPVTGFRAASNLAAVLASCAVVTIVAPKAWLWALALLVVSVLAPAVATRRTLETDLTLRTLSGGLARYGQDGVLGVEVVRECDARAALTAEHERSLTAWFAVQLRLIALTSTTRGAAGVLAAAAGTGCLVTAGVGTAAELLIAVLVVGVVIAGSLLSDALRTVPVSRSVLARAAGPLRAATAGRPFDLGADAPDIRLTAVTVAAGTAVPLRGVNLCIEAGTHVAVVGASGAGKSSLLAVLVGWLVPSSGEVHLGGRRLPPGQVPDGVAWSAPETRLWNDTVAANVAYGSDASAASTDRRLRTAQAASVAPAVAGPGHGRRVGDGGGGLSDGEAQRVRFARALGRPEAPLVVLDEPFRGLERPTRQRLLQAAREQWRASTLVCALHDIADTRGFDLVVLLDAGSVVEAGEPGVLAADAGSRYSALLAADRAGFGGGWTVLDLSAPPR